jgi:hypothetical protein
MIDLGGICNLQILRTFLFMSVLQNSRKGSMMLQNIVRGGGGHPYLFHSIYKGGPCSPVVFDSQEYMLYAF